MDRVQEELTKTDEMILNGEEKLNMIKKLEQEAKEVSGKIKGQALFLVYVLYMYYLFHNFNVFIPLD